MSEYQYYEFQTADRRLSEREIEKLRSYSTRAVITATSFSNEYSFGDFKGNKDEWMEKYFDGFVYLANWGTHEFQLALPTNLLSAKTARLYCDGSAVAVRAKAGRVILTFCSDEEADGGWVEGGGVLSALLPLRAELAQGDLRALYVGWLLGVQAGGLDEEVIEPPVPPGLGKLSGGLSALVEFLRIDQDLLAVTAEASPRHQAPAAQCEEMAAWVGQLPVEEKDQLLVRLMTGENTGVGAELCARFLHSRAAKSPVPDAPRRTAGQLLAAAEDFRIKREGEEARKEAEEIARQERRAATARRKHLDALVGRESELWTKVDELVATKLSKSYDVAVQHLVDLHDLALRQDEEADFSRRLGAFRTAHSGRSALVRRLRDKGL